MQDDFINPQLAEDIAISRRELAEGKGIPHAQVMKEMNSLIDRIAVARDRRGAIPERAAPAPIPAR